MEKGSIIGYDPSIVAADSVKLRKDYFEKRGYQFLGLDTNPVNDIWTDRPSLSDDPVFRHEDVYTGQTFSEKLAAVIEKMQENILFTNALDEIAWLLNLRGNDIEFNPVFFSFLAIEKGDPATVRLFIKNNKLTAVAEYLESINVKVHDYNEINQYLAGIEEKVITDSSKASYAHYRIIKNPVTGGSIISDLKSIKNPREIQGFRDSHIRDGVAVCKYFAFLEKELQEGKKWTEYSAAKVLEEFRKQGALYMGLSFGSISSVGANAAIIHYKPEESTAAEIVTDKIYLLDSGGHYLDGTIDTTRTVHFGTPSD